MKTNNFILLILITVIPLSVINCDNKDKMRYEEKVFCYEYTEGELDTTYLYKENKYDSKNRLLRRINYDEDGTVEDIDEYVYDDYGNEVIYKRFEENGYLSYQKQNVFDSHNNIIKTIRIRNNQIVSIDSFVHVNNAITEKWTSTVEDGLDNFSRSLYAILNEDNKVQRAYTGSTNDFYEDYTYNEQGLQATKAQYANGKKGYYDFSTYDSVGNRIELIGFYGKYVEYHFVYEYDDEGRVVKEECLQKNPYVLETEYDHRGRIIKETETGTKYLSGDEYKVIYKHKIK